jgi:predicted GH43/DUF377 family glycosyl hydrolase
MANPNLIIPLRTPYKIDRLVLAPSYRKGLFDSHAADCPFVFSHGQKYYMTYVGWDSIGYRTGIAESDDLTTWKKLGMILDRGGKGSPTEYNIALTGILRDNELYGPSTLRKIDGRYVGTYHAYPNPGYEAGPGVIGLCFSEDLFRWEVGNPVLVPDNTAEWESGGLYKSWLMEHDGTFYLFYNAKNRTGAPWIEQTGMAHSSDLKSWRRYEGNPVLTVGPPGSFDEYFASDPCVLSHNGSWIMFYFGLAADRHARDGAAYSGDLRSWEKFDELLIDAGKPGSCDEKYAHKPAMITRDGRLYHFYCAVAHSTSDTIGEIRYDEVRGISVARNSPW